MGRMEPNQQEPREWVTKSGKVLSDADIQKLADEAEAGYDWVKPHVVDGATVKGHWVARAPAQLPPHFRKTFGGARPDVCGLCWEPWPCKGAK